VSSIDQGVVEPRDNLERSCPVCSKVKLEQQAAS